MKLSRGVTLGGGLVSPAYGKRAKFVRAGLHDGDTPKMRKVIKNVSYEMVHGPDDYIARAVGLKEGEEDCPLFCDCLACKDGGIE